METEPAHWPLFARLGHALSLRERWASSPHACWDLSSSPAPSATPAGSSRPGRRAARRWFCRVRASEPPPRFILPHPPPLPFPQASPAAAAVLRSRDAPASLRTARKAPGVAVPAPPSMPASIRFSELTPVAVLCSVRTVLTASRLLTPDHVVERPIVVIEDGVIADIASQIPGRTARRSACRAARSHADPRPVRRSHPRLRRSRRHGGDRLRAQPHRHISGPSRRWRILRHHRHRTSRFTRCVPLTGLAKLMQPPLDGARPVGIHLEGPFLSPHKRGAHAESQLLTPSIALFDRMWEASEGNIRVMTIAPELPNAEETIAHATKLGVRVSLGHSDADMLRPGRRNGRSRHRHPHLQRHAPLRSSRSRPARRGPHQRRSLRRDHLRRPARRSRRRPSLLEDQGRRPRAAHHRRHGRHRHARRHLLARRARGPREEWPLPSSAKTPSPAAPSPSTAPSAISSEFTGASLADTVPLATPQSRAHDRTRCRNRRARPRPLRRHRRALRQK